MLSWSEDFGPVSVEEHAFYTRTPRDWPQIKDKSTVWGSRISKAVLRPGLWLRSVSLAAACVPVKGDLVQRRAAQNSGTSQVPRAMTLQVRSPYPGFSLSTILETPTWTPKVCKRSALQVSGLLVGSRQWQANGQLHRQSYGITVARVLECSLRLWQALP